jgi:hypothetical protein
VFKAAFMMTAHDRVWLRRDPYGLTLLGRDSSPISTAWAEALNRVAGHHDRGKEIGSFAWAQELLRQGHTYLDGDGDGVACESLR